MMVTVMISMRKIHISFIDVNGRKMLLTLPKRFSRVGIMIQFVSRKVKISKWDLHGGVISLCPLSFLSPSVKTNQLVNQMKKFNNSLTKLTFMYLLKTLLLILIYLELKIIFGLIIKEMDFSPLKLKYKRSTLSNYPLKNQNSFNRWLNWPTILINCR